MKKYLLGVLILSALVLTGCKKEWEEKVMTIEWYQSHPKETIEVFKKCWATQEKTPICTVVIPFVMNRMELNEKDRADIQEILRKN